MSWLPIKKDRKGCYQSNCWRGWLRDKECGEKADMDRGPCRPNVFAMDDVFMTERPEQVFIQTAAWSLSHSFLSDLWLWWDNKWWWELEWRSIAVESNLNKHSTHAFLICPNSDEAERPSQKIAYLSNPAEEDVEPSVTLCRWGSLSQVSLHTCPTIVELRFGQHLSLLGSAHYWGAAALLLLLLSLCAALDDGSAHEPAPSSDDTNRQRSRW